MFYCSFVLETFYGCSSMLNVHAKKFPQESEQVVIFISAKNRSIVETPSY